MTEKDYEIQKLRREVESLTEENNLLHARIEELEKDNDDLFDKWMHTLDLVNVK